MVKMLDNKEYSQDRISLSRNKMQDPATAFLEIAFIGPIMTSQFNHSSRIHNT